jgi:hypothetical protein
MDFLGAVAIRARLLLLLLFTASYAASSQSNGHIIFHSGPDSKA